MIGKHAEAKRADLLDDCRITLVRLVENVLEGRIAQESRLLFDEASPAALAVDDDFPPFFGTSVVSFVAFAVGLSKCHGTK